MNGYERIIEMLEHGTAPLSTSGSSNWVGIILDGESS